MQKQAQYGIDVSLETMVRKRATDPDTASLLSWVRALATGGVVSCEKQRMAIQQASQGPKLTVNMSREFLLRHATLAGAIRRSAAESEGKWSFTGNAKSAAGAVDVSCKKDVVQFLLKARRLASRSAADGLVSSF